MTALLDGVHHHQIGRSGVHQLELETLPVYDVIRRLYDVIPKIEVASYHGLKVTATTCACVNEPNHLEFVAHAHCSCPSSPLLIAN